MQNVSNCQFYIHKCSCFRFIYIFFCCFCVCASDSTTHFAFAFLLRCFYVFFSRLPLLLRFKSYQQAARQRSRGTHTHGRNTLTEAYGMCSATKLLRESLLFFFSNNFELPLALAHLYPPAASTVDLPYTLFACLIMHFNAQSMTVCLAERGCCCAGEMVGRAAGRQARKVSGKQEQGKYLLRIHELRSCASLTWQQ